MGGKGSGRRSGQAVWGDEEQRGTKEIIIRKPLRDKDEHPAMKALNRKLSDVDDMDVTEFVHTAFDAGADALWVFRVLQGGEEMKVGTVKADATIGEDVETFLMSTFGGPGTFVLKPAVKTAYGGYFRAGKNKRVRLGVASEADAGFQMGMGGDADAIITRTLAREEKMHALQSIQKINAKGGDQEMKAEELLLVVKEMKSNDKTGELLLEMLKSERERNAQIMQAAQQRNPLELLAPLAGPLFSFLDKKLSPGTVGKWIEMLRNPAEPAAPESFWSGFRGLLTEYSPVIQPILADIVKRNTTAQPITNRNLPGRALHAVSPTPPAAGANGQQPEGAEDMATREYDDEDTKEVLDYVMTCLDEHKFPEAWAALRTCPDTQDVIAAIVPGADPTAFWFAFKDLDERLRTRKDVSLEFIGYIQKQIEAFIASQQAAQTQDGGEQKPAMAPATA